MEISTYLDIARLWCKVKRLIMVAVKMFDFDFFCVYMYQTVFSSLIYNSLVGDLICVVHQYH